MEFGIFDQPWHDPRRARFPLDRRGQSIFKVEPPIHVPCGCDQAHAPRVSSDRPRRKGDEKEGDQQGGGREAPTDHHDRADEGDRDRRGDGCPAGEADHRMTIVLRRDSIQEVVDGAHGHYAPTPFRRTGAWRRVRAKTATMPMAIRARRADSDTLQGKAGVDGVQLVARSIAISGLSAAKGPSVAYNVPTRASAPAPR